MKRIVAVTALVVSLAAGSFAGGTWWAHRSAAHASANAATGYTCPMHPDYHSDHPGNCPICGMPLKAVRAGAVSGGDAAARALDGGVPHGAVQVSPERQQAIGVRLGVVSRSTGTRLLRTTGRVAPDENRTYPIVAAVSGWIRNVENVTTGDAVKRDQALASFVAPEVEFRSAQQSVLHGSRSVLPHGRHAAAGTATGSVAHLRARQCDRPDGRRATDPGRLQLAAARDGQSPRARAGHPRGVAGGRHRAEAERLAGPAVRSRLRVLPGRGSQPRVDSGRRLPPPGAVSSAAAPPRGSPRRERAAQCPRR